MSGESDCAYLESPWTRCRAPSLGPTKAAEKTRVARMLGQRERGEEAERPKQNIAAKVDEEYKKTENDCIFFCFVIVINCLMNIK